MPVGKYTLAPLHHSPWQSFLKEVPTVTEVCKWDLLHSQMLTCKCILFWSGLSCWLTVSRTTSQLTLHKNPIGLHFICYYAIFLPHSLAQSADVCLNQGALSEGETVKTPNPGFRIARQYLQSVSEQLFPSLRFPLELRSLTWQG